MARDARSTVPRLNVPPATLLAGLVVVAALALLASACQDDDLPEDAAAPEGATREIIVTEDGLELSAHLWHRGHERIVIYLHEFRDDQSSWWPIVQQQTPQVSALTFDFRGHGASEGEDPETGQMVLDARAAIEFVRALGYERVMLVGAGMGAAIAVVTAVDATDVTVIGFSTPADFDTLETINVVEHLDGRVRLIASRDDVSAADSLHRFRALGNIEAEQTRLYPGRAHGVEILDTGSGADVRTRFEELLDEFWVPPDRS